MSEYVERYWRDAKPEDAIKEPPMLARFRDDELAGGSWERLTLIGYCRKTRINWRHLDGPWLDTDGDGWACCQVYDAPDPGEGWKLIDPEKDKPQEGDEYCEKWDVAWKPRNELSTTLFAPETFYRRRIEQPKPEPQYEPFRWEDREKLKGRWIAHNAGNLEVCPMSFFSTESNFFVGTQDAQKLLDHWHFMDTGEPVGRRVE